MTIRDRVYAIIVTYNPDVELLQRQNFSLKEQADGIIYVDNHSESTEFLTSIKEENIHVIFNKENLGLAKAQNQGIKLACEQCSDFVILFDQDSVPPLGFVSGLLKCFKEQNQSEKVALVGPAIRDLLKESTENKKGVLFKGMSIHNVDVKNATEVSYCIASGSLIPIKVLDDVGLMEECLFIDGLDVEWCLRAKSKGYRIYQTANTFLDHCLGNGNTDRILSHSPRREYYIMRNSIWMIRQRHIPIGYRLRKAFLSIGRLMQSVSSLKYAYVKADLKGIIHGIKL